MGCRSSSGVVDGLSLPNKLLRAQALMGWAHEWEDVRSLPLGLRCSCCGFIPDKKNLRLSELDCDTLVVMSVLES